MYITPRCLKNKEKQCSWPLSERRNITANKNFRKTKGILQFSYWFSLLPLPLPISGPAGSAPLPAVHGVNPTLRPPPCWNTHLLGRLLHTQQTNSLQHQGTCSCSENSPAVESLRLEHLSVGTEMGCALTHQAPGVSAGDATLHLKLSPIPKRQQGLWEVVTEHDTHRRSLKLIPDSLIRLAVSYLCGTGCGGATQRWVVLFLTNSGYLLLSSPLCSLSLLNVKFRPHIMGGLMYQPRWVSCQTIKHSEVRFFFGYLLCHILHS